MKLGLFLILNLLIIHTARAEYRAFLLRISEKSGDFKIIKSTLDPLQYKTYFTVPDDAIVTYDDTWMCYGRTEGQPICPSPKELLPQATTDTAQSPEEIKK